jgi:hypothetical protein
MARKVWTAQELERLSPAEQDAIFESSVVTDLDQVPAEFLSRVRERLQARIAQRDLPKAT